jgi:hypothetical protein
VQVATPIANRYIVIMRCIWFVMLGVGALHGAADAGVLPPPIAVKSASAASMTSSDSPAWKLLMPSGSTWCQAGPGTRPGEPLAIALVAPTALSSVEVTLMNDSAANPIASAEVVADGKSFTAARSGDSREIDVKLSGAPVAQLVVRVTAKAKGSRDVNCVDRVQLRAAPGAAVVYGVSTSAAAALWPSVEAAKQALHSCSSKALAAQLAFPFENSWYTMDNDGMKERTATYKTAAAATKACKAKKFRSATATMKLVEPRLDSLDGGRLDVSEGGLVWRLELAGDHWRVRGFSEGG